MPRVLLASLFHETHCFVDATTGAGAFRIRSGPEILARAGDASVIDGFLEVAAAEGFTVVPVVDYAATPSGPVEDSVFESFSAALEAGLREALAGGLDAIWLGLHGAMITVSDRDVEGTLLARLRAVRGAAELPIFGAFDLHANLSPRMCALADGLVCYRENPHIDARATAVRSARLLARCLRERHRPHMRYRKVPMILPPTGTGTGDLPMRALEAAARDAEKEPGILAVNVVGGFSFADSPDAGMAFSAVAHDTPAADRALERLAAIAWQNRHHGLPVEADPDELISRILPVSKGPVLLVEPADNIGGGAPGDCTDLLRALLRHDTADAGIVLADAAAVAALAGARPGESRILALGGRGSRFDPGPVSLDVTFVSRGDGRFTLEDRQSHAAASSGVAIDMGPSAVVRHRGLTILLNTRKTAPFDLGQWRSQGVEPARFKLIVVKAAVAHRRAYDPIAAASYTLRTRGPCTSDLTALPYTRLRRPIFPLDAGLIQP
ncbi:MAG: M81 family metallopeptidase [Acetobacteraceae bacterium]